MSKLTISQVAKAANVNVETIRYYEKRGLLCKLERNDSGYRQFSQSTIEDVLLIKRAQEIGFTLNEIKHLLALIRQEEFYPTEAMHGFAIEKINEINETIARLEHFRALLQLAIATSRSQTHPKSKQDCPVLNKIKRGGDDNGKID